MHFKLKALLFFSILAALNTAHLVVSDCSDSFFDCKNGKCIAHFFQCDDDNDCGNFEDEMNCFGSPDDSSRNGSLLPSLFNWHKDEKLCPDDHFACNDIFHTCLPKRWVCDGMTECSNGADEKNCTADKVDCGDDFKCTNLQCVPSIWRCDGISDCDDNSDEKNCTSFKKTDFCDKEHGLYQCTTGECIPYSKVCDKHPDCLLEDDEGVQCHVNSCHDKKCSHLCMYNKVTNASTCYCPPGYRLNNETCHDFNECDDNKLTNVCSQKCINLEGSYKCDCFEDYQMVNLTCQAKGPSPVLYFSTGKEIRAYDLRNKTYYPVIERKTSNEIIVGMDMLGASQKLIVFGSTENSHGVVYEVQVDGDKTKLMNSHIELLYHEDLQGIEGLAVDWLASHFYITESSNNRILVCNFNSIVCTTLMSNLSQPRGILTIPTKGKLFWTQWGEHSGIFQAAMDGSDPSLLLDKVYWPNDLALDEEMNRLYWCDGKNGVIEFYDFDTQVRHLVFNDHNRQPYSLFVFEDNLYWSDWATNQIEVCNKISGHHMKPIIMNPSDRFFGLTVYHPLMHKASARLPPFNPCDINLCSHICLLKSATSYSCRCPDHMFLGADNRTCVSKTNEPFLLLSTGYKVLKYYLNTISSSYSEELKFLPIYNIAEIAYNFDRDELYIHDTYKNRIGALDLKKKGHLQWRTLVFRGLNGVMSLVYDVNTDNLYWVDMIKGTLEVASTQGHGRAILDDKLVKPISLAICAPARKMYIGLRSSPAEIISLNMDGKSKQSLTKSATGLPLALGVEGSNQLLWGDPVLQKIEFLNIGNNQLPIEQPHKLISSHVDTINSIAIVNETVYWTNIDSATLYYSSMEPSPSGQNQRVIHRQRLNEHEVNLDLLKVILGAKQQPVYDYCLAGKHRCAHLCLISTTGPSCKCSEGYASTNDGFSCVKMAKPKTPPSIFTEIFNAESFFDKLTEGWKQSNNENGSTWYVKFGSDHSKVQTTVLPATDPAKTEKATPTNLAVGSSSSVSTFVMFCRITLVIFLSGFVIFAYFVWKKPSLRSQLTSSFNHLRNRESKQVRFFMNQNCEPDLVTGDKHRNFDAIGDNPFK